MTNHVTIGQSEIALTNEGLPTAFDAFLQELRRNFRHDIEHQRLVLEQAVNDSSARSTLMIAEATSGLLKTIGANSETVAAATRMFFEAVKEINVMRANVHQDIETLTIRMDELDTNVAASQRQMLDIHRLLTKPTFWHRLLARLRRPV